MTVLAHAGHWLAQLAYLAPLVVLAVMLITGRLRARREQKQSLSNGRKD